MPIPPAKKGAAWCISYTAADAANHLATTFKPVVNPWFHYTSSGWPRTDCSLYRRASGNLTTTSTHDNIPATAVGTVIDINMAPSGKLLAVGGTAGLQVFHFNGAESGHTLHRSSHQQQIDKFWDNANHLYAIGASKLFVFTVTPTSLARRRIAVHNRQSTGRHRSTQDDAAVTARALRQPEAAMAHANENGTTTEVPSIITISPAQ